MTRRLLEVWSDSATTIPVNLGDRIGTVLLSKSQPATQELDAADSAEIGYGYGTDVVARNRVARALKRRVVFTNDGFAIGGTAELEDIGYDTRWMESLNDHKHFTLMTQRYGVPSMYYDPGNGWFGYFGNPGTSMNLGWNNYTLLSIRTQNNFQLALQFLRDISRAPIPSIEDCIEVFTMWAQNETETSRDLAIRAYNSMSVGLDETVVSFVCPGNWGTAGGRGTTASDLMRYVGFRFKSPAGMAGAKHISYGMGSHWPGYPFNTPSGGGENFQGSNMAYAVYDRYCVIHCVLTTGCYYEAINVRADGGSTLTSHRITVQSTAMTTSVRGFNPVEVPYRVVTGTPMNTNDVHRTACGVTVLEAYALGGPEWIDAFTAVGTWDGNVLTENGIGMVWNGALLRSFGRKEGDPLPTPEQIGADKKLRFRSFLHRRAFVAPADPIAVCPPVADGTVTVAELGPEVMIPASVDSPAVTFAEASQRSAGKSYFSSHYATTENDVNRVDYIFLTYNPSTFTWDYTCSNYTTGGISPKPGVEEVLEGIAKGAVINMGSGVTAENVDDGLMLLFGTNRTAMNDSVKRGKPAYFDQEALFGGKSPNHALLSDVSQRASHAMYLGSHSQVPANFIVASAVQAGRRVQKLIRK